MIEIPKDPLEAARFFVRALPQARELGLEMTNGGPGWACLSMPWQPHLIGNPERRVIHGGAVSTLVDTACGTAVLLHPERPGSTATLDLRIEYMRAAHPEQTIHARAECHHITRSIAFVRALAYDDDRDNPVAIGSATFTVDRSKPSLIGGVL